MEKLLEEIKKQLESGDLVAAIVVRREDVEKQSSTEQLRNLIESRARIAIDSLINYSTRRDVF